MSPITFRNSKIVYYGPHTCENCGVMIVKMGTEWGGTAFTNPDGPIYPNTEWHPHVCDPVLVSQRKGMSAASVVTEHFPNANAISSNSHGYVILGGLSEYSVIPKPIIDGDEGCYLLPIKEETGYVESALKCADATADLLRKDGFLPSKIAVTGEPRSRTCCLTGNCQFATVWLRLATAAGEARHINSARRALDYVMRHQDIESADLDVRGAIKGSHPVWGSYAPLTFPNWATKFFVDALWLAREVRR